MNPLLDDDLARILAPHAKARGLVRWLGKAVTLAGWLRVPIGVQLRVVLLMVRLRQAEIDRALARAGYSRGAGGVI